MTRTTHWLVAVCALVSVGCQTTDAALRPRRPNVILMMADDLASNDLSCYGGRRIQTPRIDQLAREGLRLTSYYAGSAVCTPSRMALLSGAYPARLGWRWGVLGYGFPAKTGMSPRVYTIAEAFRDAGYRTAIAGKWHLGADGMLPERQGFDSALYIRMSNNQNRDLYRDGELVQRDRDNRLLTETFAEEAVRVIREEHDEPFFLYVPWSAPHFPADPHPDWHGRSGNDRSARYADVVAELDFRVGQVLDALEQTGRADDTIVVFTSDNGRQRGQEAKPPDPLYRGTKWQTLEGGTRVPCIVRFPGGPRGAVTDRIVAAIDLYPTLAAACDVPVRLPEHAQQIDGIDLEALRKGEHAAASPGRTELLYWHGRGRATAIRIGDWKLQFHHGDENPKDPELAHGPALFHLRDDVGERRDVAAAHPERVQRMLLRAKQLLTEVYAEQLPLGSWPGVELPAPVKARDVWGPWLDRLPE